MSTGAGHSLRRRRLVSRVGIAVLMLVCGAVRADEAGTTSGADLSRAGGEEIYRRICAGCHMSDGRGARGGGNYPALAGDPALTSKAYMARVLIFGRRNMPAFGPKHAVGFFFDPVTLTDEQIASVVNYVRTHFGNHFKDGITAPEVRALDAETPTAH